MRTKEMELRIQNSLKDGDVSVGDTLEYVLPSDCSGNGYDIAVASRPDESGRYELGNGIVADVEAMVFAGRGGPPVAYRVHIYRPDSISPLSTDVLTEAQWKFIKQQLRKLGYAPHVSGLYLDKSLKGDNIRIDHTPWGFATNSGKFFPHVRTTRYWGSGHYQPAQTNVYVSEQFLKKEVPDGNS